MQAEPLWTAGDVAAYLKVSVHTVRKWRERERIPYLKINGVVRYQPAAIAAWAGVAQAQGA